MAITVYTKPGCAPCRLVINKFHGAGLTPQIVDLTENEEALEYVTEELGYSQTPVIVYEKDGTEDHWSGPLADKITKVIELEQAR